MKKLNTINCNDIERVMISKNFDEITDDENITIKEHLKSCAHCRSYQYTLLNLQNTLQVKPDHKLSPDPNIRRNIIKGMKSIQSQEPGIFSRSWQYIRSILEYRIPVYQALSGAVLILLILFAINQLYFSINWNRIINQEIILLEVTIPDKISAIKNIDLIDQQKIGRNVKEDSLLARFIVPSM